VLGVTGHFLFVVEIMSENKKIEGCCKMSGFDTLKLYIFIVTFKKEACNGNRNILRQGR